MTPIDWQPIETVYRFVRQCVGRTPVDLLLWDDIYGAPEVGHLDPADGKTFVNDEQRVIHTRFWAPIQRPANSMVFDHG